MSPVKSKGPSVVHFLVISLVAFVVMAAPMPRAVALPTVALPAAALPGVSPDLGNLTPSAFPTVSRVEIRSDLSVDRVRALSSLITLTPGEPFSPGRVRRTLRNLQASGRVAEAAVYSRPELDSADGRVLATVVMWSNVLVADLRWEGDLGLAESRLRSAVEQKAGQPLVEGKLLRSIYHLQDLYRDAGFMEAEIRLQVRRRSQDSSTVTFVVECGPRTRVGSVRFEGDLGPFRPAELMEELKVQPTEPFRAQELGEDPGRLQRWLVRQGYRTAKVRALESTSIPLEHRVELAYAVEVGSLVEVEVAGAELKKLEARGLLSFLDDEGYDSVLLPRAGRKIESFYQSKGHYQANVTLRERREAERLVVEVDVAKGPSFVLREVLFSGNLSFRARQLMDLMETRPRQGLRPGGGRLVDDVLDKDMGNLRSFYALAGFHQSRIAKPEIEVDGSDISLTIGIQEGPQLKVASLLWEGVEALERSPSEAVSEGAASVEAEAASLLFEEWLVTSPLKEGGPYHPRRVEEAVKSLTTLYRAAGFEWVQVEAEVSWPTESLADITVRVRRGPRMLLDRLIIRGNLETRTEVVRRFVGLKPGEPVSRSRLLEVERRLARLGIFSRVDVNLSPGEVGGTQRDVVVRIEEGRSRRVSYGLGYDSDDGPRGLLGFSHKNLWGRSYGFQLDARVSGTDERYRVLLTQPSLGAWGLPLTYSLFSFDEDRESFQQRSLGLRVEGRKELSFGRLGLAYDFRTIELEDVEEPLDRIDPLDREIEISSVIPSLLLDYRDDPFDPRRGWSTALELQYAFPAFSTGANFLKLFVQQTGYFDLGSFGVLAGSLRLGAIEPLEGRFSRVGEENPVPIGERFFAGGRTSHRAYERDLLGIDGSTRLVETDPETGGVELLPIGGNGLLLANLEYRFPIVGTLGGTLFLDAGNIWRDWRSVDLDEVRYGAGLGLRYLSPIGPVRLEVGWNLDRQIGEESSEIHLTFGNPF